MSFQRFIGIFSANVLRAKTSELILKPSCNSSIILIRNITQNVENSSTDSDSESQDFDTLSMRLRILDASLKFVPTFGWSRNALSAGAESIGLSPAAHGMINHGGAELVLYLNYCNNLKLEELLKKKNTGTDVMELSIDDYLHDALKIRLEMTVPFLSKWSEGLALMALPNHVTSDFELLMDLTNKVWFYSGDKHVNIQWYSRRLALGAAYKFTELSLIHDTSENFSNSWMFLERQIGRLTESDATITEMKQNCHFLSELSEGAFLAMRNIIGMRRF